MWELLQKSNISLIHMDNIDKIQMKNYTCQYVKKPNHNELAKSICKYKVQQITDLCVNRRELTKLKKYEQVASDREMIKCVYKPNFWMFCEENEVEIIGQITNGEITGYILKI